MSMKAISLLLLALGLLKCVQSSKPDDKCGLPVNDGFCEIVWTGYFYNPENQTCTKLDYSGCYEDPHSFTTLDICQETCVVNGCPDSEYGCCPDGLTFAEGPGYKGCAKCPIGFRDVGFGDTCLKAEKTPSTWFDAYEICIKMGTVIIEPRNAELNIIADAFNIDPWIGASDQLWEEGVWLWASNHDVLNYTDWAPGEPDNAEGGQHCAAIVSRGFWADFECETNRAFICETTKVGLCGLSEFGCCRDQTTSATGPNFQDCHTFEDCDTQDFGCCPDHITPAKGPDYRGCPETVCRMPKSEGPCKGELERFYFNTLSGTCEQFVYGGCPGNDNNFLTWDKCDRVCLKKDYSCEYRGQRYRHGENFTVDCNTCSCDQSIVRCTKDQCEDSCPENWLRYGDFCFSIDYSRRYTYGKAEEKCMQTPGASVVTPKTPEQNKQLTEVVEYLRPESFWIGMKAVYHWNDGTDLHLWHNWMKGSTLKLCVRITPKGDRMRWLPIRCGVMSRALCQIPVKETL